MACALTTTYTWVGCDGGPGGIAEIGLCELANKTGSGSVAPTIAAGVITAWTLATGKIFRKYVVRPETSFWTDDSTKDPKTGAYSFAPTVNFTLNDLSTPVRQEALLILQNNLMVITKSNDGVYRVGGVNYGMQLVTNGANGGTVMQDGKKNILNLVGVDTIPMYEVSSGLISTLMP